MRPSLPVITQFLKFGIVGGVGFLVDVGALKLCMSVFGMGPYDGRVISFLAAVSITWLCNRHFTFRGQGTGSAHAQWLRFLVVCAGGFVFNYGAYAALIATQPLVAEHPVIGVAAGSVAGMFFNFFMSKRVVFR